MDRHRCIYWRTDEMKTVFLILSTIMLISSIYSFFKSANVNDATLRLLYSNLGCSQLIIGTLVVGKLKENWEDL